MGDSRRCAVPAPVAGDDLAKLGHDVRRATREHPSGVGQAILCPDDALVGGSDDRRDGVTVGL